MMSHWALSRKSGPRDLQFSIYVCATVLSQFKVLNCIKRYKCSVSALSAFPSAILANYFPMGYDGTGGVT